jgi:C4-dicarboxylate transporter DctM subunit
MSPTTIGFIGLIALLVFMMIGVHVSFCMLLVGFVGYGIIGGFNGALSNLAILPFDKMTSYEYSVMPLFVLMSTFIAMGGIGADAYLAARAWFGQFKGGLAMATAVACGLFAACAGTSMAGTLVFGRVSHPEMKKLGYEDRLACGVISAGGTLGILIPPSMAFVLIGILTNLSIGKLLISGILPGITVVIFYIITIIIWCRINPNIAPGTIKTSFKEKVGSIPKVWAIALIFILVMGGIYTGVFTPTEAAGIGAFGSLVLGVARGELKGQHLFDSLVDGAKMAAGMMMVLVGAFLFNSFMAVSQLPVALGEWMLSLHVSKYVLLMIILVFYIILGTALDSYAVLILTIPIMYPAIKQLGWDPIWFSVLMVRLIEVGNISPPFGINLFAMGIVVDVPQSTIMRGVIPFIISDFFNLILLSTFPIIATFLPSIMFKF